MLTSILRSRGILVGFTGVSFSLMSEAAVQSRQQCSRLSVSDTRIFLSLCQCIVFVFDHRIADWQSACFFVGVDELPWHGNVCRRRVNAQSVCFVGVDELFSHGNVCGVSACCPSICNDSVEHRFVSCSDVLSCCVWGHVVLWCGRLFYCAVLICRRLCCGSKRNAVPSCEGALNFKQRMWIVCSLVLHCVVFFLLHILVWNTIVLHRAVLQCCVVLRCRENNWEWPCEAKSVLQPKKIWLLHELSIWSNLQSALVPN